jgi:hypothetical protein
MEKSDGKIWSENRYELSVSALMEKSDGVRTGTN